MLAVLQIVPSGFLAYQSVKIITLPYGEIPYFGGPLGPLKVKVTFKNFKNQLDFIRDENIFNTFWTFKKSTKIAVIESSNNAKLTGRLLFSGPC